jgi:hypothetical protein
MLEVRISQNLFAALLFAVIGAFALYFGSELEVGTASEMGPGYLPRALGWAILGLGLLTGLSDIWAKSPVVGTMRLRPLVLILSSACLFAYLIESAGFVLASVAAIFVSLFALERPTLLYAIGMITLLPLGLALVFVIGLGLQFNLWWF